MLYAARRDAEYRNPDLAQIDFQDGRDAGNYPAAETRLDIRHMFLILIGVMFITYATLTTFPDQAAYLNRVDEIYI